MLVGHKRNASSYATFHSGSINAKSNRRTRVAIKISCSIYVMLRPMQPRAPALNAMKLSWSPLAPSPNHLSGRYSSGSGKIAGLRCAVYAGTDTVVLPGIHSPSIHIPSGPVFRFRPAAEGGDRRSDSSRQARKYGRSFTWLYGTTTSRPCRALSSSCRSRWKVRGFRTK